MLTSTLGRLAYYTSNQNNSGKYIMSKRNLLLCFDAFGTLFTPKRPIAKQYGEVARSLGLGGFSDEQLQASFKDGMLNSTSYDCDTRL